MKIHLLSGFLGSGKTTAIRQATHLLLQQGKRVGIITNDQGAKLVDGSFFKSLAIPSREVVNGCFCCNYDDLEKNIASLVEMENTDIIFAESVGSCTDIVATVLKPLLQFRPEARTTVSTFADIRLLQIMLEGSGSFDENVRYIYLKQLEEASILIINKKDLVSSTQLKAIKQLVSESYPGKSVLCQNSMNQQSIEAWLAWLDGDEPSTGPLSLDIDYDRYAEGEARMAWFDQTIKVVSTDNNALKQAEILVNTIYKKVVAHNYPIGHLKFLVNNSIKISFTAAAETAVEMIKVPAVSADLLINMRVQATPAELTQLVQDAYAETILSQACKIIINSHASFQPGYPKPVYRM